MNITTSTTSRRRLLQAAAWTAPVIAFSTAAPAASASVVTQQPGDLAIQVIDPAVTKVVLQQVIQVHLVAGGDTLEP